MFQSLDAPGSDLLLLGSAYTMLALLRCYRRRVEGRAGSSPRARSPSPVRRLLSRSARAAGPERYAPVFPRMLAAMARRLDVTAAASERNPRH